MQAALRRTMEKYTSACRFILVCNNACKVIEPVRSRCVCIRVAAPTKDEIKDCLAHVAKKESLNLPVPLADRIATASNRNLRRAILMLETCKVKQNPLSDTQVWLLSRNCTAFIIVVLRAQTLEIGPSNRSVLNCILRISGGGAC